eukprot:14705120-Alexandrium_andersonii.AAC.1
MQSTIRARPLNGPSVLQSRLNPQSVLPITQNSSRSWEPVFLFWHTPYPTTRAGVEWYVTNSRIRKL